MLKWWMSLLHTLQATYKKCRSGLKGVKHTHERPVLGGVLVIEAFAFFFVYFSLAVLGEKR